MKNRYDLWYLCAFFILCIDFARNKHHGISQSTYFQGGGDRSRRVILSEGRSSKSKFCVAKSPQAESRRDLLGMTR